ncbi:hypothetical protein [Nocardia sp. CS682]|uniref:DUF6630 family protein n=1 Tax=Nocardia sp. CS682 TaxID=1047172 RepID=UPI0010756EA8|nr:hypothetical protein [Nocardia sp. CS682]QBS39637.1 hypothetical protein DMB37_05305 [Nocardia sp. CS682]
MNDRAARVLGVRDGFGGLDPAEGLASGLRTWVDGGIECRGEVVCWAPAPADADDAPGRLFDLVAWEQFHNDVHLGSFVPVDDAYAGGPLIGVDAQRILLRQGIALAREVGRLAGELSTPIPLRCIIATTETNGKFRFYRIRPDDDWSWLFENLDHGRGFVVVIDFLPRSHDRFQSAHIAAPQRAALFDLVELLAPDVEKARGRLKDVLENASWSAFDPEDALIEALFDSVDSGLAYFDRVIAGPDEIRSHLEQLSTCPEGLTWDWYDGDTKSGKTETALRNYLRLLADQSRVVGTALIGVFAGERGLALGFLSSDKLERFIELAAAAEAEIIIYGAVEPDVD